MESQYENTSMYLGLSHDYSDYSDVVIFQQDPVYQRIRELLRLKEQLVKQIEECRKEQQSRFSKANASPT